MGSLSVTMEIKATEPSLSHGTIHNDILLTDFDYGHFWQWKI